MEKKTIIYPVGEQDFGEMRENGYLYVDKTEYVYRMTHSGSKYVFLSRPRRFGKTLLASTLQAYFEGKKELFQGLAIENLEKEWLSYPVLHFDMSAWKAGDEESLQRYLHSIITKNEKRIGVAHGEGIDINIRMSDLITAAYEKYGRKVVVLIDEYDAPLLNVVYEDGRLPLLRQVMRNFYSPLKPNHTYLRFVFLTGITKFSQLSIFSELNNMDNISLLPDYAAVCGITEDEMLVQMNDSLTELAAAWNTTKEEAVIRLKENYDGYHFAWPSPDMYNPFSLMLAFKNKNLGSYWFTSGTPTYLIKLLRKYKVTPMQLGSDSPALETDFDVPPESMVSLTPLLYQSGYITIKGGNPLFQSYTLGIPNKEVRIGLMNSLAPYYLTPETQRTSKVLLDMAQALYCDDMDRVLHYLQAYLQTIPYTDNADSERHYQQVLFVIFNLLGMYVDVEIHSAQGRMDMVMRTAYTLYIIELKLNKDAETAMRQIDLKQYDKRFTFCGLPIMKVGINFDLSKRTLTDWRIEKG